MAVLDAALQTPTGPTISAVHTTRTPGLVAHQFRGGWMLHHQPSGLPLHANTFRTLKTAKAVAAELGEEAVDWTVDGASLIGQLDDEMQQRLHELTTTQAARTHVKAR